MTRCRLQTTEGDHALAGRYVAFAASVALAVFAQYGYHGGSSWQ